MCPEIFGLPSYGLICAIGMGAAVTFCFMRTDRQGLSLRNLIGFLCCAFAGMVAGAKLVFFISRLPYLWEISASAEDYVRELVESGYVFYGGVLGAYAGMLIRCRITDMPAEPALNFFTPAFALFHAIGRIGCFCAGCCYGVETEHLGFVMDGVRRFPVQLVESFFEYVMFAALLIVGRAAREKKKSPKLSFLYLMSYSVVRFILEFLRGDEARGFFGPLSTSQWIALIVVTVGIISRLVLSRDPRGNAQKCPKCRPSKLSDK